MSARFIAAVLSAALTITTVTATASDAREHRRDNQKAEAALGIAALIALGLIIADKKDDDGRHVTRPRPPRPDPRPRRVGRYELPAECLKRIETRNGMRRIFAKRCLQRNYHWVNRLPKECRVRVRDRAGHKRNRGFAAWCLKRHGYRLARW